jgi:hypothetical protein
MSIDENLFDKEEFKKWLKEKPDRSPVGWSGMERSCPLAQWMNSLGFYAEIGSETKALIKDASTPMFEPVAKLVNMPLWASRFIKSIDHWTRTAPISKERALQALENA